MNMVGEIRRFRLFLVITTAVLFASFAFNAFGAMSTLAFVMNFKDSEALVVNQINCRGAYYADQMLELKKVTTSNLQPKCDPGALKPYSSQFGLQGKIYTLGYRAVNKVANVSVAAYVAAAQLLTALLTAACLALLVLWVRLKFSLPVANIVTFLLAVSPMMVGFARNLYWAIPLVILLILYPLYAYTEAATRQKRILFWIGLGLLFYIRFLCGYEYLTTLTIMVAAIIAYYLYIQQAGLKKYAQEFSLVLAVAVIGFALALGTHIVSLQASAGSASNAVSIIKKRAMERTADSGKYLSYPYNGLRSNLGDVYQIDDTYFNFTAHAQHPTQLGATFASFLNYAFMPVFNLPIALNQTFATYAQSLTAFLGVLVALFMTRKKWARDRLRQTEALFLAAATGFVGYASWLVLARSHSLVHAHINGILLYMPFALFGYMLISLYIHGQTSKVWKKLKK